MFGHTSHYDQQTGIRLAAIAYAPPLAIAAQLAAVGTRQEWRLRWLATSAGHLIYVCQHRSNGQQVVAICGSVNNPLSEAFWIDWAGEDLAILRQQPLPSDSASGRVSIGAWRGLESLLKLRDASTGISLLEHLSLRPPSGPNELVVLGHSLGGSLTSLLALYLYQYLCRPRGAPSSCLLPISFAAPTVGDADFAACLEDLFDGYPQRYYNSLDMVPHTWSGDGLNWITASYSPGPAIPTWFRLTTETVKAYLSHGQHSYRQPGAGVATAGVLGPQHSWFAQVAHQHAVSTYQQLYDATPVTMAAPVAARQGA